MMTEIQTVEGGQKRCPPKEDQHLKKKKRTFTTKKSNISTNELQKFLQNSSVRGKGYFN